MRLAVLGAGRWGRNYIRTIAQLPGLTLSCVASRNPETKDLVPAGCRVVSEWREALALADGIVIAAPSSVHAEMARAAVEAGKPVLLEKPVALSSEDARALLSAARAAGVFVLVDHILLFHPAYVELKRRAASLGPPRAIEGVGGNAGPWRADASALWDYGPHDVAAALDLAGLDPTGVSARREAGTGEPSAGENIRISLDFSGGLRAALFVGNAMPAKERRLSVRYDKHAFVMDDLAPHKLTCDGHPVAVAAELPLTRVIEAFAAGAAAGSRDLSSLELGSRVVEVLARCQAALSR